MFRDYTIKKRDDIYQEDLPYIQDPYWTCHKLEQLQLEENTSAWLEKLPDNASSFINFPFHSHAQTAYKDFLSSIKFGNLVALRKPFFGEEVLGGFGVRRSAKKWIAYRAAKSAGICHVQSSLPASAELP